MSRIDKKLLAMRTNPQDDWKIQDLKNIAQRYSINFRQPGTSHVTFSTSSGLCLTVPAHKPIKIIYIKRFIELIDAISQEEKDD